MDNSDNLVAALEREISELETYLRENPSLPPFIRQPSEASLAEKRAQLARLQATSPPPSDRSAHGSVEIKDAATMYGPVVGVNLGRIIYGRDPEEDEREQVQRYLERLAAKMSRLPLTGLTKKIDTSTGVALADIYVLLALETFMEILDRGPMQQMAETYCEWLPDQKQWTIKPQYSPLEMLPQISVTGIIVQHLGPGESAETLPIKVGVNRAGTAIEQAEQVRLLNLGLRGMDADAFLWNVTDDDAAGDDTNRPGYTLYNLKQLRFGNVTLGGRDEGLLSSKVTNEAAAALIVTLLRDVLATEALAQERGLVVLGDPGSGKSTLLRHLAWVFAQRGLDQASPRTRLFGWSDQQRLLPIFLPLRTLAGYLARQGQSVGTVSAALRAEMTTEYDARRCDDLLDKALYKGKAIILFDGLDEVPPVATPDVASRQATLQAARDFAHTHARIKCVVTCRTRAFTPELDAELGWQTVTLAPFTVGQMRHFIDDWYRLEAISSGQIDSARASAQRDSLFELILNAQHLKLREMAGNPLLLTMMALVLFEQGQLPRDRPTLYEQMLTQLLGQWDTHRGGQSLSQVIGDERISSDQIRPILDRLSYEAHRDSRSEDGRGRLRRDDLLQALTKYFRKVQVAAAYEAAERCVQYFDERSGLLLPEDDGEVYAFAHLTLQEHCAGRHLLLSTDHDAVSMVMKHRADDRWREPIFLGTGVIQQFYPPLISRIESILTRLIDDEENGQPKDVARWHRDLILAAELGVERDWDLLRAHIEVPRLQRDLRKGLAALLNDPNPPLTFPDRLKAAELLASLGDPRFPVAPAQWQAEQLSRTFTAEGTHYWRFVRGGTYRIGGWDAAAPSADIELPPFWIARFPVTVAQYAAFMAAGGYDHAEWWTPLGWKWKQAQRQTEPALWNEPRFSSPNQPVVGITWYEARAFCSWLNSIVDYKGLIVRLPTEAEWEALASYDGQLQRQPYPWGAAKPTPELAVYEESGLDHPAAVGLCVQGAASCGALDMAGNVWEWTKSLWLGYPEQSQTSIGDAVEGDWRISETHVSMRGGAYYDGSISVLCAARVRLHPIGDVSDIGFRLCVAADLAQ